VHQKKIEIWNTFSVIRIAVSHLSVLFARDAPVDIRSFHSPECRYSKSLQLIVVSLLLPRMLWVNEIPLDRS